MTAITGGIDVNTYIELDPPGPGTWQRDDIHLPRPVPRSYAEVQPAAAAAGFQSFCRRYGLAIDRIDCAFPAGFAYLRVVPLGEDEGWTVDALQRELGERERIAGEALAERRWLRDLETWDREARPQAEAAHRRLQSVALETLDTGRFLAHLAECRAHLHAMITLHHAYDGPVMAALGLLMVALERWGVDPAVVRDLTAGASPLSGGRMPELERLAHEVRERPAARQLLLSDEDPAAVLAALADFPDIAAPYQAFIDTAGYRLVGHGLDHGNPYLLEMPDMLLTTIRAAVEQEAADKEWPHAGRAAEIRDRVPPDEREIFDTLYEEARATYRLRDERSLYADVRAAGIYRRALLEAGRRLASQGHLTEPTDAFEAESTELAALLAGERAELGPELAARARQRAGDASAAPPDILGAPPTPPRLDLLPASVGALTGALLMVLSRVDSAPHRGPANETIRGVAAGTGVYRGPARLVEGPEGFARIRQGDVLVVRTTSEAFNVVVPMLAAVVTDRGGILSHAAIVARECGIPAVVGCRDATRRIPDGAMVTVDGNSGEVIVHD